MLLSVDRPVLYVDSDELCWLRMTAAIADPSQVLDHARLQTVHGQLQQELRGWTEERWVQDVPWHTVRDWLRGDKEKRTGARSQSSCDFCHGHCCCHSWISLRPPAAAAKPHDKLQLTVFDSRGVVV